MPDTKTQKSLSFQYQQSYNSFSGCDITVSCNILGQTIALGTIQTVSYSVYMERSPVRAIGNINAKDYTQGPRTIAGSLVFAVFDKHILYHMIESFNKNTDVKTMKDPISNNDFTTLVASYQSMHSDRSMLIDELPPFDIVVTFANEYGSASGLVIYGVRLVNEGQVMSINDIYTENTYQFVATDIDYMNRAEKSIDGKKYSTVNYKDLISDFEDSSGISSTVDNNIATISPIETKLTLTYDGYDAKSDTVTFTMESTATLSENCKFHIVNTNGDDYGIGVKVPNRPKSYSYKITQWMQNYSDGIYDVYFTDIDKNNNTLISNIVSVDISDAIEACGKNEIIPPYISIIYKENENVPTYSVVIPSIPEGMSLHHILKKGGSDITKDIDTQNGNYHIYDFSNLISYDQSDIKYSIGDNKKLSPLFLLHDYMLSNMSEPCYSDYICTNYIENLQKESDDRIFFNNAINRYSENNNDKSLFLSEYLLNIKNDICVNTNTSEQSFYEYLKTAIMIENEYIYNINASKKNRFVRNTDKMFNKSKTIVHTITTCESRVRHYKELEHVQDIINNELSNNNSIIVLKQLYTIDDTNNKIYSIPFFELVTKEKDEK